DELGHFAEVVADDNGGDAEYFAEEEDAAIDDDGPGERRCLRHVILFERIENAIADGVLHGKEQDGHRQGEVEIEIARYEMIQHEEQHEQYARDGADHIERIIKKRRNKGIEAFLI